MDIFHARVIRCPRGQRQKNRHLIIASCMPLFAISSQLVSILGVNVENSHSFFHRSALGHLCGTSASWGCLSEVFNHPKRRFFAAAGATRMEGASRGSLSEEEAQQL